MNLAGLAFLSYYKYTRKQPFDYIWDDRGSDFNQIHCFNQEEKEEQYVWHSEPNLISYYKYTRKQQFYYIWDDRS